MTEAKYEFLQSIANSSNLTEVVKFIVDEKFKTGNDSYEILATTNVNPNNKRLTPKALLNLYSKVYSLMYKYIAELDTSKPLSNNDKILRSKFERGELKKSPTPEEIKKFFFVTYPNTTGNSYFLHSQSGEDVIRNNDVLDDFIHVYPFGYPKKIDCRLYFNTTPENSCKIGELLLEECFKRHLRAYFKFDTAGDRNDSMLIYTNYEHVNQFVEIINKIRKKHPKLFAGAEKSGLLTAKVDDCIFFGEEPEYQHSSFNAERADAIDEFIKSELAQARRAIGNYTGNFRTRTGENLNLKDYIIYRLKASYMETLEQTQLDIKNGIFPRHINQTNVKDYIEIENHIYNECKKRLPDHVEKTINENAEKIIEDFKNGRRPVVPSVEYKTLRLGLSGYNKIYEQNLLKKHGYLRYAQRINLDIEKKFFDIFNIQKTIKNHVTLENLEPFFNKHHCSTNYPHLNTETDAEFAQIQGL